MHLDSLLVLVVIAALVAGGWLFLRSRRQGPRPTGGGASSRPEKRDWSAGEVEQVTRLSQHEHPRYDALDLLAEAIRVSGVEPNSVDRVKGLTGVWAVMRGQAAAAFESVGNRAAAAGVQSLGDREDFDDTMLWNYFGHWGPQGIAVQHSISELFSSGQLLDVVVDAIRSGSMAHDLGGSNKL